jgi:NADH:ubiquinone oxidoreductase subunit 5 (subunit L)/multisubunit Na+/H+ antiporter MnhA subunit
MSIIAAGWKTAGEGWFARFAAPYDVPAIAAEFQLEAAPADAGELAVLDTGDHGEAADGQAAHGEAADSGHGAAAGGEAAAGAHGGEHGAHDVHHTAHVRAMTMSIFMAFLGILLSWWVYYLRKVDTAAVQARLKSVYTVLQGQYFFDEFYAATVYRLTLWWAAVCRAFDTYVIDGIVNGSGYLTRWLSWLVGLFDNFIVDGAVNGVAAVLQGAGEGFRRLQTGRVQTYLVYASASIVLLVLVYRVL